MTEGRSTVRRSSRARTQMVPLPPSRVYVEVPMLAQWAKENALPAPRRSPSASSVEMTGASLPWSNPPDRVVVDLTLRELDRDSSPLRTKVVRVRSPGSEAGPSKRSRSKQDSRRHRRTDRTDSEDSDRPRRDKRKRKPKARPRRSSIDGADTEDEDATAAIELDEPDRFKSDTRLRTHRKTNFQSKLRQLSKRRVAQGLSQDVHGSSSEDSESDSSSPSASSDSRNFIASDDDIPNRRATVPEEFSLKRETPEQKFKVVFHYLVVLIIRGARNFLPLQGEDNVYFGRQLYNVRKTMRGLRDSMAGALWRPDFRDAIETYPLWKQAKLDKPEDYCDACNRRKQKCFHYAWLRGDPYDSETHEDAEESDDDDKNDSDSDARELGDMGNVCLRRAHDFHELVHWEHQMFLFIRRRYHCLVRAKAKRDTEAGKKRIRQLSYDSLADDPTDSEDEIADKRSARKDSRRVVNFILKRGGIPDLDDPNQVTIYMDDCGWQTESMRWLGRIEARARNLDHHN